MSIVVFESKSDEISEIELLASDSLASIVVAEVLQDTLSECGFNVFFALPKDASGATFGDVIKGLQVRDEQLLIDVGVPNLVRQCLLLRDQAKDGKCTLNITGGYKGTISILMIVHQLYEIPMVYLYEDTGYLVSIPDIPLNFNWKTFDQLIIEENGQVFFAEDAARILKARGKLKMDSSIMGSDGRFTVLGKLLWERFMEEHYNVFYMTDSSYEKLLEREEAYKMLQLPLAVLKTDRYNRREQNHLVFSDTGKGINRFYYYIENTVKGEQIHFYQIFGDGNSINTNAEHEAHTDFIKSVPKEKIRDYKNNSTIKARLIDKKKVV